MIIIAKALYVKKDYEKFNKKIIQILIYTSKCNY